METGKKQFLQFHVNFKLSRPLFTKYGYDYLYGYTTLMILSINLRRGNKQALTHWPINFINDSLSNDNDYNYTTLMGEMFSKYQSVCKDTALWCLNLMACKYSNDEPPKP